MPPLIGFAVLTHTQPGQVARLVDRLHRLYGRDAPVAIHHDHHQCRLDPALVPGALLVDPSLRTSWGTWSLVEATLAALRLLHAAEPPEYTVLLSGADYPCATAERVLGDLRSAGADAFLRARPVRPWQRDRVPEGTIGLGVNEGASNQEICYRRYYSTVLRWNGLRFRIRSRLLAPLLSPFSSSFPAYAGDQWWTLSRKAVGALLDIHAQRPDLVRWFAQRPIPDEAYIQTVIANAPGLRLAPGNFRHLEWTTETGPRTLHVRDVPRMLEAGAHFARKFEPNHPALDVLDEHLGLPRWDRALEEPASSLASGGGASGAPRGRDS